MRARLGTYEKKPFQPKTIDGVNEMALRFRSMGGYRQQERMIHDKRRTLDRAVHFSYQAAEVRRVNAEDPQPVRALINPNQVKPDYDEKILSVGFEYNFNPGDVFEWLGTNTHWLVYLQDLTELAYFRADIRKCSYQVIWEDEQGNEKNTWIALRGPVETRINSIQKNGISLDLPNHSLHILMPKNEDTLQYFQRYSKFYIQGADDLTSKICWRVEATDTISMPGILEINAVEYYSNVLEDDVETGIVGGLVVSPEVPDESQNMIYGETFIKPKKTYEFIYRGRENAKWHIDKNYPIEYEVDNNKITLTWMKTFSGQFTLSYGSVSRTIVVESLF